MSLQRFDTPIQQHSAANAPDEVAPLAQALYSALLTGTPRRAALMSASGARKYGDAPKGHLFSVDDLRDHLAARRTWAVSLADGAGLARAGCRDYDAGGEQAICAALAAARAAGLVAFGIVIEGSIEGSGDEHSGGHVWTLYRKAAPAVDIRAQLAALPGAKGEIYPSGNAIRLPLGLHRRKGTRGTLLLQDGQRYDLDTAHGLLAGLRVIVAMERNAAPPIAPAATQHTSGGTFGSVDMAEYASLIDGALLMGAPRYQAMFRLRPQLAAIARGERVPLPRDGVLDDSDSAQVAVLICNLLTSCKKGQKPGQGAPPLSEIRAIALHWKPALRDGRSLAAYRSQIEYEIARYRPEHYEPRATDYIPGELAAQPQALAEAAHRGRPAGQRAEQGAQLLALLTSLPTNDAGERETTRAQLAQAHGCKPDMITLYLRDLRACGLIAQQQTARGMRLVIKSAPSEAKEARNRSDQDRSTTPEIAPPDCMEKHTRPLAPGGLASDGEAAPLGSLPSTATQPAEADTPRVCFSPSGQPATLRTPKARERHEMNYRRECEIMANTEAYEPTEADTRRSEARKPRPKPRTPELDDLAAVLDACWIERDAIEQHNAQGTLEGGYASDGRWYFCDAAGVPLHRQGFDDQASAMQWASDSVITAAA